MFYIYILYSKSLDRFYKGQTSNIQDRIKRHNSGYEKATQKGIPWKLVCVITKPSRAEAVNLEKKLKNMNRSKTNAFITKYDEGIRFES